MSQTPRSTVGTVKSWNSRYSGWTDDSYALQNRAVEEMEQARLRPNRDTHEEFPWLSQEFEPIRSVADTKTNKPPQWFKEGQQHNRNLSVRSQRSGPRESIVDLHLIVSDLDYYAGAVHDYQAEEEADFEEEMAEAGYDEEQRWPQQGQQAADFGRIQIVRNASKMGRNGTVKRNASSRSKKGEKDINLVTWDGPDDPDNPKNWTKQARWMATLTVSLFTFISPVSSSMVAPALTQVLTDFGLNPNKPSDRMQGELAMSVFILGFAIGPLALGPLSELFGRRIVLQLSNLFYFAFNLACGFANNTGTLVAFRFLAGLGGSAPLGIGGGVLADIWLPTERGKAMAFYSLAPLLGPAIGPIAGGFIAQYSTWRWVFYSTSIAAVFVQLLGWFFLKETYAAAILSKKKKQLIKITGNKELRTEFDNPSRSLANHIGVAFKRPFILLFTQPIVQVLALYIGYVYGVLYLVLASFPVLWMRVYGEGPAIGGLNYISLGLGFFLGTQVAARFADRIYKKLKAKNNDQGRSEFRVPLMFPGAVMVPVGLLIYGWSAQYKTHWIVPNIGTAIFAAGNQLVFQNCQTYLVDAYTRYAASAIAATAVFRSLGGFAFPLFADQMYQALGYGWGNTTLAFVGIAVGFPAPFILWWYGEALRKKSTFAAG
ncbi:Efflux pump vrtL [Pseudocercospora fuligena]|uniref:Cercosporin MFS transporter CTB4 n=1 Tax=Pseudocercospora fuligena TaxID=685502 RepID=A0A8H6VDU4_9PEZI|nr:Efflux pump vrtL [Pseudocercospora fuligena]